MGVVNPTYDNRVKYTLQHEDYGSLVITEPKGWRSDEKEYTRNKKYHGILTKFSNSLKFINDGADYITLIRAVYGINADIRLIREEQHPNTDEWIRSYDGFLDLSTYKSKNNEVSVKFNASGLEKLIKARESEKVEIERENTIDGDPLPSLPTKNVELEGRRIFLKSKWETKNTESNISLKIYSDAGNTRSKLESVPLTLVSKSHENAHSVLYNTEHGDGSAATGNMIIAIVEREHTYRVKINLSFKYWVDDRDYIDWSFFKVCLTKYKNGTDYNNPERIDLLSNNGSWVYHNQTFTITYDDNITLFEGESLAFEFYIKADFHNNWFHRQRFYMQCKNIACDLTIEEDSFFDKTNSKVILAHELGERLVQIATNKDDAFYSEALGRTDLGYDQDGENSGAFTGFAHGHWIRGFDKLPIDEENKYKAFTTSFKEYIENLTVTWNLGLGIEKIGFKERIRIEKLEYFYNNNVTIKLPNQVKNVERSEANRFNYSGLEFGFTKGGEYEEAMGLDEYNTKSTFTTAINRVKKLYRQISKYRADSYGMEFARRKPKSDFSTEDTRYDKSVFILDLKRWFGINFKQRKWQDDFAQEPTGTFSPETATNLRFSPFNILLRHSWVFASGLTKYLTDYVRYGSSEANSNLSTRLIGGNEYAENGNIINSELKRPRFVNEWIEFEHIADFDIMQQVEGFTTILGKQIPNFYGLVQFINEKNETEKGYLFNLKPNGSGKWKLLKANR